MYDGKTIWFIVRGIAGTPSDFLEWEYEARDWAIQNLQTPAVAVSYTTSFLTVWKRRQWRAKRFAKVLRGYISRDWRCNIICHSEGTVVALDALKFLGWPRIENLHLVCGACDSDFQRLGINQALRCGGIGNVHCWIAGQDTAMLYERIVLGKLLFGIPERSEPLGLHGPRNVNQQFASQVHEHWESPWDKYNHSTCWEDARMNQTMSGFINCSGGESHSV
jgi:hypothetical protein